MSDHIAFLLSNGFALECFAGGDAYAIQSETHRITVREPGVYTHWYITVYEHDGTGYGVLYSVNISEGAPVAVFTGIMDCLMDAVQE